MGYARAMKLIGYLKTLFEGSLPDSLTAELIHVMNDCLVEARKFVAVAIADEKRIQKQWEAELALSEQWEQKAKKAATAGNSELESEATKAFKEHEEQAEQYRSFWEDQKKSVEELKDRLKTLNRTVELYKRNRSLFVAKHKAMEARRVMETSARALDRGERLMEWLIKWSELQHDLRSWLRSIEAEISQVGALSRILRDFANDEDEPSQTSSTTAEPHQQEGSP